MTKLVKRELILLGIEASYGVDPTLDPATDAILVEGLSWSFAGARNIERPAIKGALGQFQSVYGGSLMELTFSAEIKGAGAAGTPPEIGQALRACGLGETIVAATSVTYAPVSTAIESATIYFYEDGSRYVLTGCRGSANINLEVGNKGMIEFTFTGHFTGPTDTPLVTPTYQSTLPAPFIGASFSILGYAGVINAINLDIANEVATPPDANSGDGYAPIIIADRDPNGSVDPEATLAGTKNWVNEWQTGANGSIETGVIGLAGNQYALTMPTGYYREIGPGDRDSIRTYEIGYAAAGDDAAFSLAFT